VSKPPAQQIAGWPEAFRNANRIRFGTEPAEADARWWMDKIFRPTGCLPLDLAERLCARAPGEASFVYAFISHATESFDLAMEGTGETGRIWLHAAVLELRGSRLLWDGVRVDPGWRERGVSRTLAGNLVALCRQLAVRTIRIDAEEIGGYHWANAGFVPATGEWRNIRDYALRQVPRLGLSPERVASIVQLLVELEQDPSTLWTIARLPDRVLDPTSDPMARTHTTLGRALLVGAEWTGELNLDAVLQIARFEEWLAHG
jgi:GNAT superfamily N-acetyltransferase